MQPATGSYKGRPIVSCCSGPTRTLDLMLSKIFTPLLGKLPQRLSDTRAFLTAVCNLRATTTDPPPPFSLDIESLYPSIPQGEAIDCLINFLLENKDYIIACLREIRRKLPPTIWIRRALTHTLQNNIFQFNGTAYRQIKGTCMGASLSVALAEVFVHLTIERHPRRLQHLPKWHRYIDDIIVIPTTQDAISPHDAMHLLNTLHTSINFTMEEANANGELVFLDTVLYRKDDKFLTKISYKSTDKHLYLHYRSFHPPSTKKAIPYSQGLRVLRNTTDPSAVDIELNRMMSFFSLRGYPQSLLTETKERLLRRDLKKKPDLLTENDILRSRKPFPLLYDPRFLANTQRTLKQLHTELHQIYHDLPDFPPEQSPMMAWRRTRNIKDILVRSAFPPPHWNS